MSIWTWLERLGVTDGPRLAGKFNRRAHFREALVCEKDSTCLEVAEPKISGETYR